jgi:hypothetical protein
MKMQKVWDLFDSQEVMNIYNTLSRFYENAEGMGSL